MADDGYVAVFSPDASRVAFIRGAMNEVWLMGPKGENQQKLAEAPPGDGFIGLAWAPDGSRVAVLMVSGADFRASTIAAYDVRGGGRVEILAESRISAIAWTADGRLIYAQGAGPSRQESYGLWEVTLDPGTARPVGAPRQLAAWMSQSVSSLSVSRDGTRILAARGRTRSNVFVGQLNTSATALSDVRQVTQDDRVNWPSAWAPDGRAVLFHSDRNGDFDLFRQASSDREAQPILLGPDDVRAARVTPDGKWILYLALAPPDPKVRTARVRLMRMPAGGGPPEQVLETAGNWGRGESIITVDADYFWSYPSFTCAAALRPAPCMIGEADGTDETVFTAIDPLRGRVGELARIKAPPVFLAWDLSPDGTRIAAAPSAFYPGFAGSVRIVTIADKSARELSLRYSGTASSLAWSPEANAVLVATFTVTGSALVSVGLDGPAHVLLDLVGKGLYLADPRPSPDGRQLAFGQATLGSNAWLFESRSK